MSLVVVTGGARSGKSRAAARLVRERCAATIHMVVAASAHEDEEMRRRIEAHKQSRSAEVQVFESRDGLDWTDHVPKDQCLLIDCLGTLLGLVLGHVGGPELWEGEMVPHEVEDELEAAADRILDRILERTGDTVVVTNEVGSSLIPPYPAGRLFRDVLGRLNRRLVEAADGAWLVVTGRSIDLKVQPEVPTWPNEM